MPGGPCLALALALAALCLLVSPVLGSRVARLATNTEAFGACVGHCKIDGASTHSAAARRLLQSDADQALWRAAKTGNATGAEEALEAGANVNAKFGLDGKNALTFAAKNGHTEVVELLIKAGSDVNGDSESGLTPVFLASERGHLDVLLALLRAGANPHKTAIFGKPRFKTAAAKKRFELQRALVDAGLEVESAAPNGSTPLMAAADFHHPHIVEELLGWGALVNRTDERGWSPLHYIFLRALPGRNQTLNAAELITGMLTRAGADVDAASDNGNTPLIYAALSREYEAMKVLIEAGAALDVVNVHGETALWRSAFDGDLRAVTILVEAGANVSVAKNGKTPLSVVCRCAMVGKNKVNACQAKNCSEKEKKELEALLSG